MRSLDQAEIGALLALDTVAHLATIDEEGYPHVTPVWFLWVRGTFHVTSFGDRPHVRRIAANPRVGMVIDVEGELRADGQRPNKQVRVTGEAVVSVDSNGLWTRRIRDKYIGAGWETRMAGSDSRSERVMVAITPRRINAVASV
ncbi:pyridoxamine 5'-phosphate oxidase family protein [Nocardia sp. NPDC057668]|uniref:pyridoxamine 5'-phosphate oxidase family protein n=1 Tax=Nocardia sp. NPDC057668 TaxID=3346202 RepID=UPI00366D0A2A